MRWKRQGIKGWFGWYIAARNVCWKDEEEEKRGDKLCRPKVGGNGTILCPEAGFDINAAETS